MNCTERKQHWKAWAVTINNMYNKLGLVFVLWLFIYQEKWNEKKVGKGGAVVLVNSDVM